MSGPVFAPGRFVGAYQLGELLGRGGMGEVYRARHPRLLRDVAIKVLLGIAPNEESMARFEREARSIAHLRHAHILTIFDFGEQDGRPYMVMEYMPSGSLQAWTRGRRLSPAEVLGFLAPLAAALDYAHEAGLVHRDVKPANVFLDAELRPVLADFGLAKLQSDESLTATGTVTGTPSYMSPEQVRGQDLGPASDQYALAVMAYELLCGRTPFGERGPLELLYAQVNETPPPPTQSLPGLPVALDAALLKGLAKKPEDRFASCSELVAALTAAAEGRAHLLDFPGPTLGLAAAGASTVGLPPPGASQVVTANLGAARQARRQGRLIVAAAAVLAVPLLIVAGLQLAPRAMAGRQTPPTSEPPSVATSPPVRGPTRSLLVDSAQPLLIGSDVSFHGGGLDPQRTAVAGFYQDSPVAIPGGLSVGADGSFRHSGRVPKELKAGPARIIACNVDSNGDFTLEKDCAIANVTLAASG